MHRLENKYCIMICSILEVALIDLQNTDRFYLSNYDYSPGIKELVIDPAIHQRLKQETTNQQRIQWTFSYWDEAEPILRDILVDQRPRKTGESH
jgi:hypothetical protein